LELDRRGFIDLPEVEGRYSFETAKRAEEPEELAEVECSLAELGQVQIERVSSRYAKASRIWRGMMQRHHPLGDGPLCGRQQRYLIWSEMRGWLGGLSFSATTPRLRERDEKIGWSEKARWEHLKEVVCNSRFLILPEVKVKNLASHVLGRVAKQVKTEWAEEYGYEPVLLETYVDESKFSGGSYGAANWKRIGQTSGRRGGGQPKAIWIYPLRRDWRRRLCEEPKRKLRAKPGIWKPEEWTEEEFGSIELYDGRLRRRVKEVAEQLFQQPGAPIPQACGGTYAKARGAYRLFANEKADMQTLLKPHVEATAERMKGHEVVLAVQDTTTLNYTTNTTLSGVGPINTKKDNGTGLILHDTVAFEAKDGMPLGLLDVQCWARDPKKAGKAAKRKDLPIEEKESIKWLNSYRAVAEVQKLTPETTVVSVGDRESDIYELFCEVMEEAEGPELLVRADKSRQRKIGDTPLWEQMADEPIAGTMDLYIPGQTSRPPRTATLTVRCK
jgi:hypothetical protein